MTATVAADVSRASRAWSRVVDGPHRWGRLSVRPVSRTLWSGRTLVVFAPGADRRERTLLRARHGWGTAGAVLALVVMAGTSVATGTVTMPGLAVGLLVYGAGFAVLGTATRRLRRTVRTLTVTTFHGNARPEVHGDVRLLSLALDTLTVTEAALRDGRITPLEFELVWGDVWCSLPPYGS
ncbi:MULTISPECIES: DUF6611 family protein [unclassified Curtobacterium]|uniref:DUF6611 family protein n=1 Tax=unclassified Curtobacterium TaxID=257496 RepID=UPI003819FEC6